MKNWITIVMLGCFVLVANHSYSQAVPCDAAAPLQDCFDETLYNTPIKVISSLSTVVKPWQSGPFTCSGTYTVAVYLHDGKIPSKFLLETTCDPPPTLDDIVVYDALAIENIFTVTSPSSPTYAELRLQEVRDGGTPVMIDVTFPGPPVMGTMTVNVFTEDWNSTDSPPNPEDVPAGRTDLTIEIAHQVVSGADYNNQIGPPVVHWAVYVGNDEHLPMDSPGTIVTVDLPSRGFDLVEVTRLYGAKISSKFQWIENGNRVTIDLGILPKGVGQGIVLTGGATRNCSTLPLVGSVTGDLRDPFLLNNHFSELTWGGGIAMEEILTNYPEYCTKTVITGPLLELLLSKP